MELGAIVVVPENPYCKLGGTGWSGEVSHPLPLWPVAGKNLVQDWSEKVRRIGASLVAVTPGGETPAANRKFQAAWNLAKQGVERLLVISLKSYAEIDLIDFVKFHQERRNSATEACDTEGPLGVSFRTHSGDAARLLPADCRPTKECGSGTRPKSHLPSAWSAPALWVMEPYFAISFPSAPTPRLRTTAASRVEPEFPDPALCRTPFWLRAWTSAARSWTVHDWNTSTLGRWLIFTPQHWGDAFRPRQRRPTRIWRIPFPHGARPPLPIRTRLPALPMYRPRQHAGNHDFS